VGGRYQSQGEIRSSDRFVVRRARRTEDGLPVVLKSPGERANGRRSEELLLSAIHGSGIIHRDVCPASFVVAGQPPEVLRAASERARETLAARPDPLQPGAEQMKDPVERVRLELLTNMVPAGWFSEARDGIDALAQLQADAWSSRSR
jgi:hypothetical protein